MKKIRAVLEYLKAIVVEGFDRGIFHIIVSLALVQGLNIIVQFLVASWLSPSDFGVIVLVDNQLNLLISISSLGMASTIVKYGAEATKKEELNEILLQCILITTIASIVLAIIARSGVAFTGINPYAQQYLILLLWTMPLINISKVAVNVFQALQRIKELANYSALSSVVGLGVILVASYFQGLPGWALGRWIYAVGFTIYCLWLVRHYLALSWSWPRLKLLLNYGSLTVISLSIERAGFALESLNVDRLANSPSEVGYYGISSLLVLALMLLPAAYNQVLFPAIAQRSGDSLQAYNYLKPYLWKMALIMLVISLALCFAIPPAISKFVPQYIPALLAIKIGLLSTPFLTMSTLFNTLLMATGKLNRIILVNLIVLISVYCVTTILVPHLGGVGGIISTLVAAIVKTVSIGIATAATLRHN